MDWVRFGGASVLCGGLLFVVGAAFHYLAPLVAPGLESEYRNEALFRPWPGWTRTYMLAHPWLFGVLFTGVFAAAQALMTPAGENLAGEGQKTVVGSANLGGLRDGLLYGLAVFVVGSLPVYALNYASFQISGTVATAWVLQSLCQYTLAGLALGCCLPRATAAP